MNIERGASRWRLIRELAQGEKTQGQLAREFGCTQQAVSHFSIRHAEEIAEHREKIDDEYAGLWVAKKAARLAVYQEDVEYVTEILERPRDEASEDSPAQLLRARAAALRAVAEELGDLPTRVRVEGGTTVRHVLEGIDTKDLA